MRKIFFAVTVLVISSFQLLAQQPAWQPAPGNLTIDLWPHGAPGAPLNAGPEVNEATAKDNIAGRSIIRLGNVSNSTITVYAPKENPTGQAGGHVVAGAAELSH